MLDFGIAKLTATEGDAAQTQEGGGITRTGDMVGTPYYMSPEQAFGENDVDHRADIWAVGVIMYECLTGKRPFQGDNIGQILKRIITGGSQRLELVAPFLPRDITQLVGRMLEQERAARPADLREVQQLLKKHTDKQAQSFGIAMQATHSGKIVIAQSSPRAIDEGAATDPLAATTYARPRRRMAMVAAGSVALLAIATVVGWRLGRTPEEKQLAPLAPVIAAPVHAAVATPPVATPIPVAAPVVPEPVLAQKAVKAPHKAARPQKRVESAPAVAAPAPAPTKKALPGGVVDQVPF